MDKTHKTNQQVRKLEQERILTGQQRVGYSGSNALGYTTTGSALKHAIADADSSFVQATPQSPGKIGHFSGSNSDEEEFDRLSSSGNQESFDAGYNEPATQLPESTLGMVFNYQSKKDESSIAKAKI